MNLVTKLVLVVAFFAIITPFSSSVSAQQSAVYTDAFRAYKQGLDFYDQKIYPAALEQFRLAANQLEPANEPQSDLLENKARLFAAKCAVRLKHLDAEQQVLAFARDLSPDPAAADAILEIGNYYFDNEQYGKAMELLAKVDKSTLTKDQRSEIQFKYGYSLFVKKKFREAQGAFAEIRDIQGEYYAPANYYYGMSLFYAESYPAAITAFARVSSHPRYGAYIPYYITQIYFSQGDYAKVIEYGEVKAQDRKLKKLPEINQLVGQSYFEQGDFTTAEPFLAFYAQYGKSHQPEDFYQLAFVQYKSGKFEEAAENFEELAQSDSPMGQNAMYLLGDCKIKMNDKAGARNAFRAASKMSYDETTAMEALYNYAKLSYDLDFDREAITTLQKLPADSPYYREAQNMLSNIFLNTRDYEGTLSAISALPNQTQEMKATYQKVAFNRGIQLMQQNKRSAAKELFNKSLKTPIDRRTEALATYWLGDIAHGERNYDLSILQMNKFFTLAKSVNRLPEEANVYTANYIQGYNYLKTKDYNSALGYFQETVSGLKANAASFSNPEVTRQMLGDATIRTGDCYFKKNKYKQARRFYEDAITRQYDGYQYAIYQTATISGLQGDNVEKIVILEELEQNHPTSKYSDDALIAIGETYLETGQNALAQVPFKKLINNYKNSPKANSARLKLGLIAYNAGDNSTAINYYKQIFSNNPVAIEAKAAQDALKEIYVNDLGQPDEYFSFIETVPGYNVNASEKENLNFVTAETQYEAGNYTKAIELYTKYLRKYHNGQNALVAHYHRAECHAVEKNFDAAFSDYEAIINRGPSKYFTNALRKAAIIAYNDAEDFDKAYLYYRNLENAATEEVDIFEAQLGAMRAAYRSGKTGEALNLSRHVISNPKAVKSQKAEGHFYAGKLLFDNRQYDEAHDEFDEVLKLSKSENAAEARYLIAYIYYAQRDLVSAQELCIRANKLSADFPYWVAKSVVLLADVLAEKGDYEFAMATLEGLLENYTGDAEIIADAQRKYDALENKTAVSSRAIPSSSDELELENE